MQITRIGPASAAKVAGALYGALGGVGGLIFSILIAVDATSGRTPSEWALSGSHATILQAIAVLLGAPLAYGTAGALIGAGSAFVYNLVAKHVGGIQIEMT
jgi:hypothetical protein